MERPDKETYYSNIAKEVALRGTCLHINHGALIVKNDEIIASGYSGAPRNTRNCCEVGVCRRDDPKTPHAQRHDACRSVHAEQNAIISAARKDMIGSKMYLVGVDAKTGDFVEETEPCLMCKRLIINAGITAVIIRRSLHEHYVEDVTLWQVMGKI